jgi:hypothetical protein
MSEDLGGGLVGREERLEVQLREGDVHCGRERRQGRDELELAFVAVEAQRHREADVIGPVR